MRISKGDQTREILIEQPKGMKRHRKVCSPLGGDLHMSTVLVSNPSGMTLGLEMGSEAVLVFPESSPALLLEILPAAFPEGSAEGLEGVEESVTIDKGVDTELVCTIPTAVVATAMLPGLEVVAPLY